MRHEILPFSAALLLGLVWAVFSWRLLIRISGTAAPWNPLKLIRVRLSLGQNVSVGVLSWGVSMCIFDLADRYIRWRLYGSPSDQLTLERFFPILFSSLFGGVLFGFLMAFTGIGAKIERN